VRTLVCEEHARVGDPVHCTGVLSSDSFDRFDLPTGATLNHLTDVRFVSPGGIPVDYTTSSPIATVIDRPAFDRALAERAVAAGGFAWAVPVVRPDGFYVRIGVMAARDALGCYGRMLERVGDRWGVSNRELPPRLKILPLGAIGRTYGDRLLAIGDAAGLVK